MAIHKVCVVLDKKLGEFSVPSFLPTLGVAEREFSSICRDKNSKLYLFPLDFAFYHVADYDTESGTFTNLKKPVHIAEASNFSEVRNEKESVGG